MPEGDRDDLRPRDSSLETSSVTREDPDEFKSWNRWRDGAGKSDETEPPGDWDEPEPAGESDETEPTGAWDETEPPGDWDETEPPGDWDDTEAPAEVTPAIDDAPLSPRRGRGRHRVKRRGWSRAPKRVGPRRAALSQRRKESAKTLSTRSAVAVVALALLAGAAVWAISRPDDDSDRRSNRSTGVSGGEALTTTMVVGSQGRGEEALWLALLSYDSRADEGSVVVVPAHTAVEVPGRGLHGVGEALENGNIELLMLSARFLLNIEIDHYLELAPEDAQALFAAVGPLTVDVPGEVRVSAGRGTARLLFTEGPQELSPPRLVELLYTVGLEGDDLELGPRHLAFWDALFDSFAENPADLAAAIARAGDIGRSDERFSGHASLLQGLAGAGSQKLTLSVLPVEPVAAGDSELYSIDREQVAEYLEDVVHAPPAGTDETRVQILNGNGFPGIGQEVAGELVGEGFQVVLTGNARSLKHRRTLIVTYDSSPEGLEIANRARDLIGVGEVQVSPLEQGIVDLTIVVGKDFLRRQ